MTGLLGTYDPPKPGKKEMPPKLRTGLIVVGVGVVLFGVVFWKELLFVALIEWSQRPHPIRTLLLRSDTPFHNTRHLSDEEIDDYFRGAYGREPSCYGICEGRRGPDEGSDDRQDGTLLQHQT